MLLEDLIGKGYFPKELPPPFNTTQIAAKYNLMKPNLMGAVEKDATRCANFSIAKVGLVRKIVKIPNPMHHCELCEIIVDNWADIETIYMQSKFSFSRPLLGGERAATTAKFKDFMRRTFLSSYPYLFELKTDISKYYPSIYTHSIPWAIHGKNTAKIKRTDKSLLGNKLDAAVQQTMYGQTIGLPMGPDTSLIISEIIGCTIDEMLVNADPNLKGYRYVDDMYFFFESAAEAENGLVKIQEILREFELQINTEKTKIRRIPKGIEPDWIIRLRTFVIRDTNVTQYNDIMSFFSMAFDLAMQMPNEYVLSYAIEKIKRIELLSERNFALMETMLLKTIIAEPSTIKEVFRFFYTYKGSVRKEKVEKVLMNFIKLNARRANDYELSWALWFAKTFSIVIPKDIAEIISKISDSISILIALDMMHEGLINKTDLDTTYWSTKLNEQSLKDENWLLAYEVAIKKWIGRGYPYIDKVPYFKILRTNKISFYDKDKQITPIDLDKEDSLQNDPETEYEKQMDNSEVPQLNSSEIMQLLFGSSTISPTNSPENNDLEDISSTYSENYDLWGDNEYENELPDTNSGEEDDWDFDYF